MLTEQQGKITFEDVAGGIDVEGRGFLVVERTKADQVRSTLLECYEFTDDLFDPYGFHDPVD